MGVRTPAGKAEDVHSTADTCRHRVFQLSATVATCRVHRKCWLISYPNEAAVVRQWYRQSSAGTGGISPAQCLVPSPLPFPCFLWEGAQRHHTVFYCTPVLLQLKQLPRPLKLVAATCKPPYPVSYRPTREPTHVQAEVASGEGARGTGGDFIVGRWFGCLHTTPMLE